MIIYVTVCAYLETVSCFGCVLAFFWIIFSPFPCANLSSRLVPLPWIISKNASMTKGHLTQISQKTFQSPKPSQLKLHISSFHQGALGILPPSALQSHWRHFTESLFGRLAGQDLNTSLKPLTNWILHGNTHRWIGMDWFGGKKWEGTHGLFII